MTFCLKNEKKTDVTFVAIDFIVVTYLWSEKWRMSICATGVYVFNKFALKWMWVRIEILFNSFKSVTMAGVNAGAQIECASFELLHWLCRRRKHISKKCYDQIEWKKRIKTESTTLFIFNLVFVFVFLIRWKLSKSTTSFTFKPQPFNEG